MSRVSHAVVRQLPRHRHHVRVRHLRRGAVLRAATVVQALPTNHPGSELRFQLLQRVQSSDSMSVLPRPGLPLHPAASTKLRRDKEMHLGALWMRLIIGSAVARSFVCCDL